MGMSASQARLIALTARMSDVEYEGQQINQQRLILTNKMSEVYEQMVNMDVPTPPSKIDFAYPKYTGKLGNTNVSMRYDDDGHLKAYQEVKGSTLETTQGTKGGAADANPANFISKEAKEADAFKKYDINDYQEVTTSSTKWSEEEGWGADDKVMCSGSYIVKYQEAHTGEETDNNGKLLYDGAGYHDVEKEVTITGSVDEQELIQQFTDSNEYPEGAVADFNTDKTQKQYVGTKKVKEFSAGKEYKTPSGETLTGDTAIAKNNEVAKLAGKKFAIAQGGSYIKVSGQDIIDGKVEFTECFEITKETDFDKAVELAKSKKVTSADGKKTGSAIEISDAQNKDGFATAYEALKHRFPDLEEDELKEKFYAVDYGDGSFAFVQKEDMDQGDKAVYLYEVGTGTYDEEIEATPTYDKNGNITGLKTGDGQSAVLNSTQGYDELAYDAAMATYTAEKVEYDREQNNLNKQTSIYQRQDKQLELKLKRLDTERNALNTEIDAVKKVIQDATDKGFKTFSG